MGAFVSFQDVGKIYKTGEVEITALHDVNFEIEKGEFSLRHRGRIRRGEDDDIEHPGRDGHADRGGSVPGRSESVLVQ